MGDAANTAVTVNSRGDTVDIKGTAAKLIVNATIKRINKNQAILDEIADACKGENRTFVLDIIDTDDGSCGMFFSSNKVCKVGAIPHPTLKITVQKDTIISIAKGRLDLEDAILCGKAVPEGENWLRDIVAFKPIIREMRVTVLELGLKR